MDLKSIGSFKENFVFSCADSIDRATVADSDYVTQT